MKEILEIADNDIIITNVDGKILYANASFLKMHSELESCITKKNIQDIFYITDQETDILEFIKERLHKTLRFYYMHKDFPIEVQVIQQVWEGEKAYFYFFKKQNISSIEGFKVILDELLYSVWITDSDGRFYYVNKAFMKLLVEKTGYDAKESVIGKQADQLWDAPICSLIKEAVEEVIKTKRTYSFQTEFGEKGSKRWYRFKISPILDDNDQVKHICGICEEDTIFRCIAAAAQKEYTKDFNDISETIYLEELEEFKEGIKEKLQADSMYIGVMKQDKFYITTKAGEAISDLQGVSFISHATEWIKNVYKKWGIIETNDVEQYIDKSVHARLNGKYRYCLFQPLYFGEKLIGVLAAAYKEEKPNLSDQMFWLPRFCSYLSVIIKNKMVGNAIENDMVIQRKKECELHSIINTAADLSILMNKDGTISKINDGWEEQLGWKKEEVMGKELDQFFYLEDRPKMVNEIRAFRQGKRNGIVRFICDDTTLKWYGWQMKYEESIDRIVFTATNVTEQLKQARDVKEEIENFKDDFLTNISHEFRTPVNVILSAVQLLRIVQDQKGGLKLEDFEKYSDKIKHNSYRLLRLTNNFIALSQLDINNAEVDFVNTNIVEMIEDIVRGVRKCIDKQKVEVRFVTNVSKEVIACDMEKMEIAVLNLISNSIKYAKPEKKTIIEISVISEGKEVCIGVKDNGLGISKDKVATIFEPFVQGNAILNRPAEGSGVGLTLVKGYIKLHHGRIGVESDEGIGSKFSIYLPIITTNQIEVKQSDYRSIVEQCYIELSDIS